MGGKIEGGVSYVSRWNGKDASMPKHQNGVGGYVGLSRSFRIPQAPVEVSLNGGSGFTKYYPSGTSKKIEYTPYAGAGVNMWVRRLQLKLHGGYAASLTGGGSASGGVLARQGGYVAAGVEFLFARRVPALNLNLMYRGFGKGAGLHASNDITILLGFTY